VKFDLPKIDKLYSKMREPIDFSTRDEFEFDPELEFTTDAVYLPAPFLSICGNLHTIKDQYWGWLDIELYPENKERRQLLPKTFWALARENLVDYLKMPIVNGLYIGSFDKKDRRYLIRQKTPNTIIVAFGDSGTELRSLDSKEELSHDLHTSSTLAKIVLETMHQKYHGGRIQDTPVPYQLSYRPA
jgi:hypothetical protein